MTEETPDHVIGDETRAVSDNVASNTESEQEQKRRIVVKRGVKTVYEYLTLGRYRSAGVILRDRLLPALDIDDVTIEGADDVIRGSELDWYYDSVKAFLRAPNQYIRAAPERGDTIRENALENAVNSAHGYESPSRRAQTVVKETAQSAHSAAIGQGIIPRTLDRSSRVMGLSVQMGLQHTSWTMDMPDPVSMFRGEKDMPFVLAVGDTSSGKSTFVARAVEDRYEAGHKVLDIHDRKKLENGVYDIAQQQQTLREVRRKLGLQPGLDEQDDEDDRELEIYVPISSNLKEKKVLYYEDGTCRIKPFAVDVSSLPDTLLSAFAGNLTQNQSAEWNNQLELIEGDWTLADLVERIAEGDADDTVKQVLITRLKTMQSNGWLRDADSDYLLDWENIFRDTDTITCFSTSLMKDDRSKYRVFLYLLSTIYSEREQKQDGAYAPATIVMRELSHIAPSRTNRSSDPVEQGLQDRISDKMRKVASESGHEQMELVSDTQHWKQVAKRVREHLNVVVMYRLDYTAAEDPFSDKLGRVKHKYIRTVTQQETGEATVIADNQRIQGEGKSYRFVQPVQMVPPACHHVDRKAQYNTGWLCRDAYTDEYLDEIPSDWPVDVPPRLRVDAPDIDEQNQHEGIVAFLRDCTSMDDNERAPKEDMRKAYSAFAEEHGYDLHESSDSFGQWVAELVDVETGSGVRARQSDLNRSQDDYDSQRPYAYGGIRLNQKGLDYLNQQ
ncbi:hypothetical protein N0B31_10230 [Salinirubellus salinus]|uniref:Uncharacterized protein n=1 Tax=Salinirubellus salinus TaxID=1364945 RepID=A0A9E7R6T1_9EURY|nr:hypothetical protein [Salinirubellus salinus]UWM56652.1 hypothetical protein N0B31_10230 [Salinirubellus salinus]